LLEEDRILIAKAKEISTNAYAPYSNFRVGAAILLDNGEIFTANNQENASYPEGLCAERIVLFYAMARYPNQKIKSIAVCGNPQQFELTHFMSPCGGCRQVMYEYEYRSQSKMRILLSGISGEILLIEGAENLLPFQFSGKDLTAH
jgi:cytidine deaminase